MNNMIYFIYYLQYELGLCMLHSGYSLQLLTHSVYGLCTSSFAYKSCGKILVCVSKFRPQIVIIQGLPHLRHIRPDTISPANIKSSHRNS